MIIDFHLTYKDSLYDRVNNPEVLSVGELSPIGVFWNNSAIPETISVDFPKLGKAILTRDLLHLAIIHTGTDSRAYILDAFGACVFENEAMKGEDFFDVYYVDDLLCFFSSENNRDFRLEVDDQTFRIKNRVELLQY